MSQPEKLLIRAETKHGERRSPLTPEHARYLIEHTRAEILVEQSRDRVFSDQEFAAAGCALVPAGSWQNVPKKTWILGLKELPEDNKPLEHRHIYFAHAYKGQSNASQILDRFERGSGKLYDLEFLVDDSGRRVAAFGYWAGYVGAGLGLTAWCQQQIPHENTFLSDLNPFRDQSVLIREIDSLLQRASSKPSILVIGAKGRCGRGAMELIRRVGLQAVGWDVEETKGGGPFRDILNYDILVNCVLLQGTITPFLNQETLSLPRRLSVVADVSCDPSSPNNPLPIYKECTTLRNPTQCIIEASSGRRALDLVAIDHLPTLLPLESSRDFSEQLVPHLQELLGSWESKALPAVWSRAEELFMKAIGHAVPQAPQASETPSNVVVNQSGKANL